MSTFSQLLLRNFLAGMFFCLTITVLSFVLISTFVADKQGAHQQAINSIAQVTIATSTISSTSNDIQGFIDTLQKNHNYSSLTINNDVHDVLYNLTTDSVTTKPSSFLLPLINQKTLSYTLRDKKLTVNYQLDFSEEITLLVIVLIVMYTLTLLIIIMTASTIANANKKLITTIGSQIKEKISHSLTTNKNASAPTELIDIPKPIDIPELTESIADIKAFIESQTANSSLLEIEAYIDSLTKLNNRSRFVQYFENEINNHGKSAVKFGVLTITRCSELQTINQIHGYNEGDKYVCKVAKMMTSAITSYKGAQLFKLNSSDFATILPNTTIKEAEVFAKDLTSKFNEYQHVSDLDSVAYTGIVYFEQDKPLGELLALADTGISIAQTQHKNSWYAQTDRSILNSESASYGNQNWRQEIDSVIENQRIKLLVQTIKPSNKNSKMYGEILARFVNSNDDMLPTASFIAMAEKLDKIVAIDRLIVEKAITEIKEKNIIEYSFGINISTRSIHDEQFLIWLERRLLRDSSAASRLIFEITEYGLQQNIKTSRRFIDMIHRVGSRITVERFGVGLTSFKFFRDLKPDFIKMDSTYTRDIDEDKNNQYFLRLMVDLAHRLSITVLAESVESQEEKFALDKLFIDGCQGYYIGKPEPL
ncbi:MAG: GGDEF domain-containing protein [Colwellia sp.]|nr:GGDEF domain-containing protein [Colwellia sp.]